MIHGPSGYDDGCRCYICNRSDKARTRNIARRARHGDPLYPLHRQKRQWPLSALLDAVPDARARLRVDSLQWNRADQHGMSDRVADTWAVKCGVHPGNVWPEWFDRGLTPLDDIAVNGSERGKPGWRNAYIYSEDG